VAVYPSIDERLREGVPTVPWCAPRGWAARARVRGTAPLAVRRVAGCGGWVV